MAPLISLSAVPTAGLDRKKLTAAMTMAVASTSFLSGFTAQYAFISVPTMRALASEISRTARSVSATRV